MNPPFQVWSRCMFFYNPWETQREIDIFWWKKSGSDICVHKQKITLKKKNGKLNKIVVSNWLFNSTEAGFHWQNATFIKKSLFFTIQDSI